MKVINLEPMRNKVIALEAIMKHAPQVEIQIKHYFCGGVYAREMFVPAGCAFTGKIHKYENLSIMSQGDMSVLTPEGVKRVQAPFTLPAPAGTKRVGYAHTDTVWTVMHATKETDLEKIESEFIAESEQEYLAFAEGNKLCLG